MYTMLYVYVNYTSMVFGIDIKIGFQKNRPAVAILLFEAGGI